MLRAAAKNHAAVTVITDAGDYQRVLAEMQANRARSVRPPASIWRSRCSSIPATTTARLPTISAPSRPKASATRSRAPYSVQFRKAQAMRYGENPHQGAAFYVEPKPAEACIATARQLQGKELSYNNVADTDAALECVKGFVTRRLRDRQTRQSLRRGGRFATILEAYDRAYKTDPTSAFGGIIAFNRPLDAATAKAIVDRQFVEVIIAPEVTRRRR
jgi:phosphoribosylaminoimidazolecarboxamide formyltransferase/IMP cyclohydrolase